MSSQVGVVPDYIPRNLIADFDLFNLPGADHDLLGGYLHFKTGYPEIFWTPSNGGHWVATRAEDVLTIQSDNVRFSSRRISVPKPDDDATALPPIESDPPAHGDFRRPLARALLPKMIDHMEARVRAHAVKLIESFVDRGECDFVHEFCQVLPVTVFLELVDLPQENAKLFLPLVDKATRARTLEERAESTSQMAALLGATVRERRAHPANDLISQISSIDIVGERITEEQTCSYASLLLNAGLDTTLALLALSARFLATHPEQRREIIARLDDKTFIRNVVEELARMSPVAVIGREIASDFDFKGLPFRQGDMILAPSVYVNFDEDRIEDPLNVNFDRKFPIPHVTFGSGAHICPGSFLARRELQIFLEEWLPRIPDFEIKPGTQPSFATGAVNAVLSLDLCWPKRQ